MAKVQFRVHGTLETTRTGRSVHLQGRTRDEAAQVLKPDEQDVVRLEIGGGASTPLQLWLHPEHAKALLLAQAGQPQRGKPHSKQEDEPPVDVPQYAQWQIRQGAQRGLTRLLFKSLGLEKVAASATAHALRKKLDGQVDEGIDPLSAACPAY